MSRASWWTDERVDRLRSLWSEGLSASQVAAQMGAASRNVIIGKVHRLKLMRVNGIKRKAGQRRTLGRRRRSPARLLNRPIEVERVAVVIEPTPLNLRLIDLTSETCKWPFGEQAPYLFCGHPVVSPPYCEAHTIKGHTKGGQRDVDTQASRILRGLPGGIATNKIPNGWL